VESIADLKLEFIRLGFAARCEIPSDQELWQ